MTANPFEIITDQQSLAEIYEHISHAAEIVHQLALDDPGNQSFQALEMHLGIAERKLPKPTA